MNRSLKTLGTNFRFCEYLTGWLTHTWVRFKAIWGEIVWVSLIYLWDGTVPSHDDALSVFPSSLMDLGDGEHGNLSQVWELFFYLIKLVSRRFLCAIDPSNGSAAPCCAKVHNKYLLCSLHVKNLLWFFLPNVWSLPNRKQNFVFSQSWRSSLFKALHGFCLLPPLNSFVSPSPAASPPAFVVVGWKAMTAPQPPGVDSDEEAVPRSPRVCLRAAASCSRLRPGLLCWIWATPSRPPRERSSLT